MIVFNLPDSYAGLQDKLIATLRTVIDPELGLNIVDLGLIYTVNVEVSDLLITIEMTLSSKFCPMGKSIINAVKHSMERTFGHFKTEINVVWEPRWCYKNITAEGLKKLQGK
ncbi:metal-sulfur cluster assembly factor [Pedobacter sp. AW31-3R]|uniref:metal-sulfur cluster assembly factor n=1 Tax=Pedobacter sp. AW31-3R TaxID=3445781 RepID=UPI003F9F91E4